MPGIKRDAKNQTRTESNFDSSLCTHAGVEELSIQSAGESRPPSTFLKSGERGLICPFNFFSRLSYQPEVFSKKFIQSSSLVIGKSVDW